MLIAQLEYQLDDHIMTQRILRIRIGPEDVNSFLDFEASRLQKTHAANGFRRGRSPLSLLRKQHWYLVSARAFQELKRQALDQIFHQLQAEHKPLIPPELLEEAKIKFRYDEPLEFAVKYLVDPSGLSRNPQQPPAASMPAAPARQTERTLPQGVPTGPQLPVIPGMEQGPPNQVGMQNSSTHSTSVPLTGDSAAGTG